MCVVPVNNSMEQNVLIWDGTLLTYEVTISIRNMSSTSTVDSTISNVDIDENHHLDCSCFQSTLKFTGTNLTALFNETLSCSTSDIASIAVVISVPPRK